MARFRHTFELKVFEQPFRNPSTVEQNEANRTPKRLDVPARFRYVNGNSIDAVRREARRIVEKELGRLLRSISMGPDGVFAVVYEPKEQKDPRTMKESDRTYPTR